MTNGKAWKNLVELLSGPRPAFLALVAAGGYFLWTEHRAHLLAALPYLLLLACPLLHLFMHRGHGGHRQDDTARNHKTHRQEGGA